MKKIEPANDNKSAINVDWKTHDEVDEALEKILVQACQGKVSPKEAKVITDAVKKWVVNFEKKAKEMRQKRRDIDTKPT